MSAICSNPGCGKTAPFDCTRCHMAFYCSSECQTQHWGAHKKQCKEWAKLRDALPAPVVQEPVTSPRPPPHPSSPSAVKEGPVITPKKKDHFDENTRTTLFGYMSELLQNGDNSGINFVMTFLKRLNENPSNVSYRTLDISSAAFTTKTSSNSTHNIIMNLLLNIGFISPDTDRNKRVFNGSQEALNEAYTFLLEQYGIYDMTPTFYRESDLTPAQVPPLKPVVDAPAVTSKNNNNKYDNDNGNDNNSSSTSTSTSTTTNNNASASGGGNSSLLPTTTAPVDSEIAELDSQFKNEKNQNKQCELLLKIALVHSRKGNQHDAKDIFEKCLTLSKEVLGASHKLTLECHAGLASTCFSLKLYKDALEHFQECHDKQINHEADVGRKIILMTNLANGLAATGNYTRGKEILIEAYGISISRSGGPDKETLSLCHNLASFNEKLKDFTEQKHWLLEALRRREEALTSEESSDVDDHRLHITFIKDHLLYVEREIIKKANAPSSSSSSSPSSPSPSPSLAINADIPSPITTDNTATTPVKEAVSSPGTPATPADLYGEHKEYCCRPTCENPAKFKCKCQQVTYCSAECQNLHWKTHKTQFSHPKNK